MNKVFFGDCRDALRQLAAQGVKVQTCVTSPPYFNLREYHHAGQIGQEVSPNEYVANLVEVFRCVWDVLADDGTLWINLGDTYAANRTYQVPSTKGGSKHSPAQGALGGSRVPDGLKPKDLIGIPWRVAFALQADGWYLRSDVIWEKPNAMPEAVKDRVTKSHEYIFMLSKSERYYFDHDAIKEEAICDRMRGSALHPDLDSTNGNSGLARRPPYRSKRSVWSVPTTSYKGAHQAVFPTALIEPCILAGSKIGDIVLDPFFGSGTTGEVAVHHDRQYIGCEINLDYKALQDARIAETIARKTLEATAAATTDCWLSFS